MMLVGDILKPATAKDSEAVIKHSQAGRGLYEAGVDATNSSHTRGDDMVQSQTSGSGGPVLGSVMGVIVVISTARPRVVM